MHVLVTGATGFTGGHLARSLAARGDRVRVLVRPRPASDPVDPPIEVVPGDLTDAAAVRRATEGVDVDYHIAAIYRQAGLREAQYRAVNATAVRTIIESAKAGGAKRVVHCSTVGVHGDIEHPPANEDAPFRPGDIYQQTK
ncbi:MAG: NAD-dependent epimerase/dehydratase family protein, partial [Actinobacteria bacterium]